ENSEQADGVAGGWSRSRGFVELVEPKAKPAKGPLKTCEVTMGFAPLNPSYGLPIDQRRHATTLGRATASPSRAASSASSAPMVERSARPSTRARRKWRWNAVTTATVASSYTPVALIPKP